MVRFRILMFVVIPVLLLSCAPKQGSDQTREEASSSAGPLFDPLVTDIDREIVPEVYAIKASAIPMAGDSVLEPRDISYEEYDSTAAVTGPREVYRIQIFTSRLITEASREKALAEEVFNLPIHLDYEVPYYKLRAGDFVNRIDAEDMIPEVRAIGYRNAWVARVVLKIREAPSWEPVDDPILPPGLDSIPRTTPDGADIPEGERDG